VYNETQLQTLVFVFASCSAHLPCLAPHRQNDSRAQTYSTTKNPPLVARKHTHTCKNLFKLEENVVNRLSVRRESQHEGRVVAPRRQRSNYPDVQPQHTAHTQKDCIHQAHAYAKRTYTDRKREGKQPCKHLREENSSRVKTGTRDRCLPGAPGFCEARKRARAAGQSLLLFLLVLSVCACVCGMQTAAHMHVRGTCA
jgi:hypothetical protein